MVTHSFFIDDTLAISTLSQAQWLARHYIFLRYGATSGVEVNGGKYVLLSSTGDRRDMDIIAYMFRVRLETLTDGFTYFRFRLKPNCYGTKD